MKTEARPVFFYLWIFVVMMIYRAYYGLFELNPSLIYVTAYLPILYFYARQISIWLVLSALGMLLTFLIPNGYLGEFIASQTYLWIIISLCNVCVHIITHEKAS